MPVGRAPLETVATSRTGAPVRLPGDAWVAMVGLARSIVTDSLGALHGEVADVLTVSPEWAAVQ